MVVQRLYVFVEEDLYILMVENQMSNTRCTYRLAWLMAPVAPKMLGERRLSGHLPS